VEVIGDAIEAGAVGNEELSSEDLAIEVIQDTDARVRPLLPYSRFHPTRDKE
jgi:hypothetical protein